MYLRLGWVVGNAGLLGAWLIIIVAFLITLCTALSMSSITSNIRIGAGGAYAIISQSLGLEVGDSLGIPRYISQGLAVTMYTTNAVINETDSLQTNVLSDSITNEDPKANGVSDADSLLSNTKKDTTSTNENMEVENLFHVNTSYDKIEIESNNENATSSGNEDIDLFSELLLPNTKDKEAIERVFLYKKMSYTSMLKLLSIAGQKMQIEDDKETGQTMVDAIAESKNIAEIFIIDRKGIVVYSTQKKMKDMGEFSLIINYNIESNTIEVNEVNGRNSISTPIFYTHGKIGHVILNVKL